MNVITLDFETYYDTEHSLAHLSAVQYVHSPLFKVWGVGIKMNDEPTEWFGAEECADAIAQIQWDEAAVVCHNTLFDAYILTQYYKVYPKYYYDTAAMARGLAPNESSSLKNTCERMFPNDKTMRKGDELVNAKGIFDLPPDIEDQIAGYCIQDVDLTYALYNVMQPNYPQSELDLIDLTCRMYVEPKIFLNRTLLQAHKDDIATNTAQLIDASGLTRAQLASQKQFAALSAGHLPQGKTFSEIALTNPDPFIRHAALSNLPKKPISRELHAHVARYSETRNIQPGKLTLVDLIKKEPAILFEFLRWTAEDGIQANRPVIEGILNSGQIDYRNFRAALACLDSLSGRNNPDRFNEKYARPLLQSETTPETLRANILRYFPDNHTAIDDRKLAEWFTAKNPQLQREAIWKSRTHLTESTNLSLRKLALDAKAPLPLRLEATAAPVSYTHLTLPTNREV